MNQVNFLNGNWTGKIIYGKNYMKHVGKELFFDLDLSQENERINGIANDIGGEGMNPDQSIISGQFDGKKIVFTKQYSSLHYFENGEHKIDRSKKGHLIYYTGNYSETDQSFSGEWEYRVRYKIFWVIPITYRCGGTWTMHRK